MNVIVTDENGVELRYLVFDTFDFEVGRNQNDFQIVIKRSEYQYIPKGARIYIPDTELGGIFRQLSTDTSMDTISVGGITWRGMMQRKIIEPLAGQDYATDSGELNAIIKARVESQLPDLFSGVEESTGETVSWQYERYCSLEDGLVKMLQSVGYKLDISYSQADKKVIVQAVPIIDYSADVEFSSDMQANYKMQQQGDGVNHLICLGKGELKNRTVYHLYIDENGDVGTTQYYFGIDEIVSVYDSGGSELPDLINGGTERLKSEANKDTFEIKVDPTIEIAVGDIVGGRDYLSGMTMSAPIFSKIVKFAAGRTTIDYTLETDRLTVEQIQLNKKIEIDNISEKLDVDLAKDTIQELSDNLKEDQIKETDEEGVKE